MLLPHSNRILYFHNATSKSSKLFSYLLTKVKQTSIIEYMSKKRIAINGFGRIGRLTARILVNYYPDVEIVAINDLTSVENLAYLFEFDSTYRKFNGSVNVLNGDLVINGKAIKVLAEKEPSKLPWRQLGVDLVIESTGLFRTQELANQHITAGAKKVVISAPGKSDGISTWVIGSNNLQPESNLLSCASCTTNAVSTAIKPIDLKFNIQKLIGLTVHAYTATQKLQDGPSKKALRDGRAAAQNLIPSSTGAAKAVAKVYPHLNGKILLNSLRVPVITGSMVYLTLELERPTTVSEINSLLAEAGSGFMKGILLYSQKDLVSSDIVGSSSSCIIDGKLTEVLGNTVKLTVWYDNEWGYSNRLAQTVNAVKIS